MYEKDKEDVIQFRQNIHTTQTVSKKETLKRLFSSLEGSITKLLTRVVSRDAQRHRTGHDVINTHSSSLLKLAATW